MRLLRHPSLKDPTGLQLSSPEKHWQDLGGLISAITFQSPALSIPQHSSWEKKMSWISKNTKLANMSNFLTLICISSHVFLASSPSASLVYNSISLTISVSIDWNKSIWNTNASTPAMSWKIKITIMKPANCKEIFTFFYEKSKN